MAYRAEMINGVWMFEPKEFVDSRGSFSEVFRRDEIFETTGLDFVPAQANKSISHKGVLRGIHFMKSPPGQAKYIWVNRGAIYDVAIDMRISSPTFGKSFVSELSETNRRSLLLGYGIGHAFLSLEDNTNVSYLCDRKYDPDLEMSISPFGAGIDWAALGKPSNITKFILSEKDLSAPEIGEFANLFE